MIRKVKNIFLDRQINSSGRIKLIKIFKILTPLVQAKIKESFFNKNFLFCNLTWYNFHVFEIFLDNSSTANSFAPNKKNFFFTLIFLRSEIRVLQMKDLYCIFNRYPHAMEEILTSIQIINKKIGVRATNKEIWNDIKHVLI